MVTFNKSKKALPIGRPFDAESASHQRFLQVTARMETVVRSDAFHRLASHWLSFFFRLPNR